MEHQHVEVTGTQIHCGGVEVAASSNYNQWRLFPAFEKKKKTSAALSLSVPTASTMSENMCEQRGYPAHKPSFCCLILMTSS